MYQESFTLALPPALSYPCNDSPPLNFQTSRWAPNMKIGLTATLVAGPFRFIGRVPKKCSESRYEKNFPAPHV
jgi:hypothetical protein